MTLFSTQLASSAHRNGHTPSASAQLPVAIGRRNGAPLRELSRQSDRPCPPRWGGDWARSTSGNYVTNPDRGLRRILMAHFINSPRTVHFWLFPALCDSLWLCLLLVVSLWLCLTLCGSSDPLLYGCLTASSSLCLSVALSGTLWFLLSPGSILSLWLSGSFWFMALSYPSGSLVLSRS